MTSKSETTLQCIAAVLLIVIAPQASPAPANNSPAVISSCGEGPGLREAGIRPCDQLVEENELCPNGRQPVGSEWLSGHKFTVCKAAQ